MSDHPTEPQPALLAVSYYPTEPRPFHEHVEAALARLPEHRRYFLQLAIDNGFARVLATVRRRGGRATGKIDTRGRSLSYRFEIYCGTDAAGVQVWVLLFELPRRLILTDDDSAAAMQAEARTLAYQSGYLIPDDARMITGDINPG